MVVSSIQKQGGYYDQKGNRVSLWAPAPSPTPKAVWTKNPDWSTNTPTGTYNPYTNTYTDDPNKTTPIGSWNTNNTNKSTLWGGWNSTRIDTTPPPPPPPKQSAGSAPTSWGSSRNWTFNSKQIDMLMSKFPNREAALKEITMSALRKGKPPTEAKAIASAFDKALGFSTIDKTSSAKWQENPSSIVPPKTGIESVDNTISREEENRKKQEEFALWIKNESMSLIDEMKAWEAERAKNTEAILKQREDEANNTFTRISSLIKELESNANNALDLNTIQAINERNRQLAAKGLLTAAQAWGASAMMTEQFRQEAEKKRLDIMKTVTESMMMAEKERASLIDSIKSDTILNETAKQQGIERINWLYTNVIGNYSNQWLTANQQIDARIGSLLDVKWQMDADIMLERAKKELEVDFSEQDRERVTKDPEARLDYIMGKLASIDANMAREGAILLQSYIQDGRFNTMSTIELLAEVQRQAAINAKSYEKSWASSWGWGWWTSSSYTPPYQPAWSTAMTPEKAAVMTPEEITKLPPEQQTQVIQYQAQLKALQQANDAMANKGAPTETVLANSLQEKLQKRIQWNTGLMWWASAWAMAWAPLWPLWAWVGWVLWWAIWYGIDRLTQ